MKPISTRYAPAAIGPYSQGIVSNGLLFTAGQIPLDPQTMQIVEGGIEVQTRQVLRNLEAVLSEVGVSWEHVIKTTVYLTDLADFASMNAIYEAHLGNAKPARSTVQVAALPRNVKIEIDLVAEVDVE